MVHCQSKDNDLGVHNVPVKHEFAWSFKRNLVGTTLFWCYLAAPNNRHASFDVFNEKLLDLEIDNTLYWTAKEDGIYIRVADDKSRYHDRLMYRWS
ncbi:S-protein homolog 74 [Linum grandiflorum]